MADEGPTIVVVGHPGHELHVHNWLEIERPTVCVLTDGSGGVGPGRLAHSRECLARTGAAAGAVFGPLSDRAWYAALLAGDHSPFLEAADQIWATARALRAATIVSDARDGYNPMHDAAFSIAAMVAEGLASRGQPVRHLVVPATGKAPVAPLRELQLDAAAVARKEAAFQRYAPLSGEIEQIRGQGFDIEVERLYPAYDGDEVSLPFYESVGKARVSDGGYDRVIEFDRHYRPLIRRVRSALLEARGVPAAPRRAALAPA
ncbi:hypothetical protein [Brevundimonas sp.]|uniref:hypothetical protein n=1 Tax=Brevundimonas sp. TaxID=1871086 RepID=UPI003D6CBD99